MESIQTAVFLQSKVVKISQEQDTITNSLDQKGARRLTAVLGTVGPLPVRVMGLWGPYEWP